MALSKKQLRILEQLERRVELCREFMNDWLLFNQILSAYPKQESNKAQLESQFLKIKSKLAREHRVLRDTLQSDYTIDNNLMNIVSGATNLENIYAQSDVSIKKLQPEWHRAFISINETLGVLEDKKSRAEAGEKVFLMTGAVGGGGGGNLGGGGGGLSEGAKKNLMIVGFIVVIIAVIYFVPPLRKMYTDSLAQFGCISRDNIAAPQ
jgi:hypothetical protein